MGFWGAVVGAVAGVVQGIVGTSARQAGAKQARKAAQEQFEREKQAQQDIRQHELDIYNEQQENWQMLIEEDRTPRTMEGVLDAVGGIVNTIVGAVSAQQARKQARKAAQEQFEREQAAQQDAWRHELDLYNEQQENWRMQIGADETAREQGIKASIGLAHYAVIGGAVLVAFYAIKTLAGGRKK